MSGAARQIDMLERGLELAETEDDLDEMYTPPALFAEFHAEFDFSIDLFANHVSAKLPRYYHAGQDALLQDWTAERAYANPPYSKLPEFAAKADESMRAGMPLLVALLPGNRTEQPWWQTFIEPLRDQGGWHKGQQFTIETRFVPKRIVFGTPKSPAGGKGTGKFNSVLVIWRRVADAPLQPTPEPEAETER